MAGIAAYGAYIPLFRLSREAIARSWGGRSMGGERSVANHDEDSITMAVEATFDCLKGVDRKGIGGLYFASTSSPYKEKQCATLVAGAVDLGQELATADFTSSLRAGTAALGAALDAVAAGSAQKVLVAAADTRLGYPQSPQEQAFGDGAAAFLVANTDVIAEVEARYSLSNEITDVWRKAGDRFVQSWEDRWVLQYGYTQTMQQAISNTMKKHNLKPKDIAKVVLYTPDGRSHQGVSQSLGFDARTQLQDTLFDGVGNTGAAHPLMVLVAALEQAKPGDRILVASCGQGSDVLVLRVTNEITKLPKRRGIQGHLAPKRALPTYERYLLHREILQTTPEPPFKVESAATVMFRDRNWVLSLHGSRCRKCGMVSFPIQRVCYGCQSKDDYDEVRLSDKQGKVFTFSLDSLAGGADVPLVQTILESEEGGARIYCMMTDVDAKQVSVGMPVEMTFRCFREDRGFYNYFWKCRPVR